MIGVGVAVGVLAGLWTQVSIELALITCRTGSGSPITPSPEAA